MWFLYKTPWVCPLKVVHGALDTLASPVQDMCIDHSGFYVLMVE